MSSNCIYDLEKNLSHHLVYGSGDLNPCKVVHGFIGLPFLSSNLFLVHSLFLLTSSSFFSRGSFLLRMLTSNRNYIYFSSGKDKKSTCILFLIFLLQNIAEEVCPQNCNFIFLCPLKLYSQRFVIAFGVPSQSYPPLFHLPFILN